MHDHRSAEPTPGPRAGSAATRRPVLLIPGWKDHARALRFIARHLISNGWPADFVTPISFRDRFGGNHDHAREIADAIAGIRTRTGAPSVDVVAHSMGGLAVRQYLHAHAGDGHAIRRAVFLATPHAGTWVAWLAWGKGGRDLRPGSPFLAALGAPAAPPGVRCHTVAAAFDTHIVPPSSVHLDGARPHPAAALTHRGLLRNPAALRVIVSALLEP